MDECRVVAGPFTFRARLETTAAPKTCAAFRRQMPFHSEIVHVRWSGEAVWMPLGQHEFGIGPENATSYPAPGQIILYPGGMSETEILIAYGPTCFASKAGQLAGNHFLTISEDLETLHELGRLTLYKGAQPIVIDEAQTRWSA